MEPDIENKVEDKDTVQKSTSSSASSHATNEFLVTWDGEDDPTNPLNWPRSKKVIHIVLISALTFVTYV